MPTYDCATGMKINFQCASVHGRVNLLNLPIVGYTTNHIGDISRKVAFTTRWKLNHDSELRPGVAN